MSARFGRGRGPRRFKEARWLALGAVVSGLIVLGLFLAARNAASSQKSVTNDLPTPVVSTDQGCQNFAAYWLVESGLRLSASVIEGLSNCRQATDGSWFVPLGPNDKRLPADFAMDQTEREASLPLRQQLIAQITGLQEELSISIEKDLDGIYDARVRPVSGHLRDGVSISRARSRYLRVIQAYLMAPEHAALAGYVGWLMQQKGAAYDALEAACTSDSTFDWLTTVCTGMEDSLSVRYPPFIWDLRSAVSLEAYLAELTRTHRLPVETQTRTQASPGVAGWDASPA